MNPCNWYGAFRIGRLLFLLAGAMTGCRTAPLLAPANLATGGWQVRQGQAIWKPAKGRPELAGEIMLATQNSGAFLVQFTKTPFSLAAAQVTAEFWQVEFGSGRRRFAGHGQPPSRLVWFVLPRALAGGDLKSPWRFTHPAAGIWRLENWFTGESLEGGFFP